jgi:hypothetical protein
MRWTTTLFTRLASILQDYRTTKPDFSQCKIEEMPKNITTIRPFRPPTTMRLQQAGSVDEANKSQFSLDKAAAVYY